MNYFRDLAMSHKDIQHTPPDAAGDNEIGECRFARWSTDEVVAGLRTRIGDRALLLEMYETDLKSDSSYDIKQLLKGAFSIVKATEKNNYDQEEAAYCFTEKIVYEILQQIWANHYGESVNRCSTPFKKFVFDRVNIIPIGPLYQDNYFGWRVEFEFEAAKKFTISQAPAPGTFN